MRKGCRSPTSFSFAFSNMSRSSARRPSATALALRRPNRSLPGQRVGARHVFCRIHAPTRPRSRTCACYRGRASLPAVPDLPGGPAHPQPAILQWPMPGPGEPGRQASEDPGAPPGDRAPARAMKRRTFLAMVPASLLAAPAAEAQPAAKVPRVGYVTSSARSANVDAFDQGLRDLGYRTGPDIIVEHRFGEGRLDGVPALIDELLRLKVDVLYAPSPQAMRAARQAT